MIYDGVSPGGTSGASTPVTNASQTRAPTNNPGNVIALPSLTAALGQNLTGDPLLELNNFTGATAFTLYVRTYTNADHNLDQYSQFVVNATALEELLGLTIDLSGPPTNVGPGNGGSGANLADVDAISLTFVITSNNSGFTYDGSITLNPPAEVPEPASLAMLLVVSGITGGTALKRRFAKKKVA